MPNSIETSVAAQQATDILQQHQGWHVGDTRFRNGYHSNGWIEKEQIIHRPTYLDVITQLQAEQIAQWFPDVQLLIGAPLCGAVIASSVARHLGLDLAVTLQQQPNRILFHRMNAPMQETKAVFVEDVICSGNDVRAHIQFFESFGIKLLGVSTWINRQPQQIADYLVTSIIPAPFRNYLAADCPMCQDNIQIKYTDIRE